MSDKDTKDKDLATDAKSDVGEDKELDDMLSSLDEEVKDVAAAKINVTDDADDNSDTKNAEVDSDKADVTDDANNDDAAIDTSSADANDGTSGDTDSDAAKSISAWQADSKDSKENAVVQLLTQAGKGLRWIFPHSISWLVIWIATSVMVYAGRIVLSNHIMGLFNDPSFSEAVMETSSFGMLLTLDYTLAGIQFSLVVLPFILATIRYVMLRAIEHLNKQNILERSPSYARYGLAVAIALGHSIFVYLLGLFIFTLYGNSFGMNAGMEMSFRDFFTNFWAMLDHLTLLMFIPLSITLIITALFATWRVNAAVTANDAKEKINPRAAATAAMLVFVLALAVITVPAAHVQKLADEREHARQEAEWEMEFGDEFGDELFLDEDGMMFGDELTQEEFEAMFGTDEGGGGFFIDEDGN
ncbi:MAG: MSCRAMM family adhesin SdrC, partial [Coriobacteriia bacterium]|nr:MSCRAMM family adhesin SdrC [Coriobacteriia bacterium]